MAANTSSQTRRGLGEFQPLQFNPLGADLCKVVLRLLYKPLSALPPKTLDSLTAISGDMPRLPFTSSESVVRVTPSAAAVMVKPKGSMH
jgi:hypothetical protein